MTNRARLAAFALVLLLVSISGCSRFSSAAQAQSPSTPALEFVSQWGTKGQDPGQLDDPQGIAVDSIANVYIADAGNGFIDKFAADGTPLLSFQENSRRNRSPSLSIRAGPFTLPTPRTAPYLSFSPPANTITTACCEFQPDPAPKIL